MPPKLVIDTNILKTIGFPRVEVMRIKECKKYLLGLKMKAESEPTEQ